MIAPALVFVAVLLLVAAWRLRRQTGLPWRRVVYSDTSWQRNDHVLTAPAYGLVGKPDYVLKVGPSIVPVEVKPGRHARAPYEGDLMQLAAYCLLLEATTGHAPPYGLLRYAQQTFKMPYTSSMRMDLIDLLESMRRDRLLPDVGRSHREAGRCRGCGFLDICAEALV